MTYSDVNLIVGSRETDFSRTIKIVSNVKDKAEQTYNHITYECYNLKRHKRNRNKPSLINNIIE